MATPKYPFQRQFPGNLATNQPVPADAFNYWDQAIAMSADGQVWTDVAAIRNWGAPVAISDQIISFAHSDSEDVWYAMGVNSGNPTSYFRFGGRSDTPWVAGSPGASSPATGVGLTPKPAAIAVDQGGKVLLVGGLPGSSSNQKYRRYNMLSGTWSSPTSTISSAASVNCIAWVPALGLFVAGHSDGVVETSPDGTTWTARTTPNSDARSGIAVGPINGASGGIVISSSASTNKVIQSVDGVTWTERTLPVTFSMPNAVYVPDLGSYLLLGFTSQVIFSLDGVTWNAISSPMYPTSVNITPNMKHKAFGRTVVAMGPLSTLGGGSIQGMVYSQDAGATWKMAAQFQSVSPGGFEWNGKQAHYYLTGIGIVSTLALGF